MTRTVVLLAAWVMAVRGVAAQTGTSHRPESPTALVVVLSSALYNDQANLREASDSTKSGVGTEVLRGRMLDTLGSQILPYAVTDSLQDSRWAHELTGGVACNVKVSCAVALAKQQSAAWVVMSKVSKTSNLIWVLSAQLIRVSNSEIILDDSTELKGDPDAMVRIGMRQFADRVIRTVRSGGIATNYPGGEPKF